MEAGENDPVATAPVPSGIAGEVAADLTAAAGADVEVPPEILAQTLGEYLHGWWVRVRSGDSGVLPVILGIAIVAVLFGIFTPENAFLRAGSLVYVFGVSTVYMTLAMGEIAVLLLGELDLSIGAVALLGGSIAYRLVQQHPGPAWPWWSAILVAVGCCALVGALQGTLVARLRIPSFVVTLAGYLLFSGIVVFILGGGGVATTVSPLVPNQSVLYNLVQGIIWPAAAWIVLAVLVVAAAGAVWGRNSARRRSALVAPPRAVIAIRVGMMAVVGVVVLAICQLNTPSGVPEAIPIVLALLGAWTLLLQRTRFGRYVYAIGGSPEAARRAGVNLAMVRTVVFTLSAATAGFGGILLGSFFYGEYSTNTANPGQLVLYSVAAAVMGGTSLFGGRGRPLHGVLGGLMIGGIAYGVSLVDWGQFLQVPMEYVVPGAVLLLAVLVDVLSRRGARTGSVARV